MTIYTKVCTKCKTLKPLTEFNKKKESKDGLRSDCKVCHKETQKKYRENNPEKVKERNKKYYENNPEKERERSKKYREDNPEKIKEWRENNPEKVKEIQKKYLSNRKKNDPLFKLSCNIRALIYDSIRRGGFTKRSKTYKILGCSFDEFKIHIESQFSEGMSWDNHGEWHFDHKTPVSWGKTEEEIIALNNYINFQPLWAEDNIRKGNRFYDE